MRAAASNPSPVVKNRGFFSSLSLLAFIAIASPMPASAQPTREDGGLSDVPPLSVAVRFRVRQ